MVIKSVDVRVETVCRRVLELLELAVPLDDMLELGVAKVDDG